MGKKNMQDEKAIIKEYESKVDSSRRITLRKSEGLPIYEHYRTIHLKDGTIIHKPLVLASPENVINMEVLAMLDSSIDHMRNNKVGATFDITRYKEDFLDDEENE